MSDYVNHEMQDAWMDDELANTDWELLQEEVLNEPWLQFDDFNWSILEQGPGGLPDDRLEDSLCMGLPLCQLQISAAEPQYPDLQEPDPQSDAVCFSDHDDPDLVTVRPDQRSKQKSTHLYCKFGGCKSGPFASSSTRSRHARTHRAAVKILHCPATGCEKKFIRADKLRDHVLEGHGHDDDFCCPITTCSKVLTRDLFIVHASLSFTKRDKSIHAINIAKDWGRCPIPRCTFRQRGAQERSEAKLDQLQAHLLGEHDVQGRRNFANTLASRGVQAEDCSFLCPMCEQNDSHASHADIVDHIKRVHCLFECQRHEDVDACRAWCDSEPPESVIETMRAHRRTLLAIWPDFRNYDRRVWEDIDVCRD